MLQGRSRSAGPPRSRTDLRDLLGEKGARAVVERYGGQDLLIPARYDRDCRLARELGRELLSLLVRFWGGCRVYVPMMASVLRLARDERIRRKRADGATALELARSEGLTVRRIHGILARGSG